MNKPTIHEYVTEIEDNLNVIKRGGIKSHNEEMICSVSVTDAFKNIIEIATGVRQELINA